MKIENIIRAMVGETCNQCEVKGFGISCKNPGLFGSYGSIYYNGVLIAMTDERIEKCPAFNGEASHGETAQKICDNVFEESHSAKFF
jgi:hypothetical protein